MGSFYLILGLIFSLFIAIVALVNNETVTVNYVFGRTEISLILLILGSAVAGALAMGLFSLFRSIRTAFAFRKLRQQQKTLQKQVKVLQEEKIFLEAELSKAVSAAEEKDMSEAESEISPAEVEVEEEPL
ncbi:MAG: LapA family protein [Clostridia bacterium]|nr:LapA family protein [Clostridia bacterium]